MNAKRQERDGEVIRIAPTSPAAPSRVIIRAACEFVIAGLAEGVRSYGTVKRAVIMTAIEVANVQHITRSAVRTWRYAGLDQMPPDEDRRPVSILSLAQSLGKPFETTRGHVSELIKDGLCVKTPTGVMVPSNVLLAPKIVSSEEVLWNAFWRMIADLKALDFDFDAITGEDTHASSLVLEPEFQRTAHTEPPRRLVSRVANEFYLNSIAGGTAPYNDDWLAGVIYVTVMVINADSFSRDPDAAWRYSRADTPPPDSLRRPATIREAAGRLNLNRELVRRQVLGLLENGRLVRTSEGLFASMEDMQGPKTREAAIAMTKAFYRMIYDLKALGVRL